MIRFIIGFVFGVFVATVGFNGVVSMADKGIAELKTQSKQLAQ